MSLPAALGVLLLELAAVLWLVFYFVSGVASALHGAPYMPMRKSFVRNLLVFGEVKPGDVFYDFGSGDGRVLLSAVRDFHAARAIGYEISPWPYWKSIRAVKKSGYKNILVRRENFFEQEHLDVTCIYAYLLPNLIDCLAEKWGKELTPGARIICPSFPIDLTKHPQFRLKKSEKIGSITAYLYIKI